MRAAAVAALVVISNPSLSGPVGGNIVAGDGEISRPDERTVVIDQQSKSLVADWESFDVAPDEQVSFIQPGADAAALNRILNQDPTRILGSLNANGRVFLANPNGVIFGRSATVDVGSLVATTLSVDSERFMSGRYELAGPGPGAVENLGILRAADGGSISLIARAVQNDGLIIARLGSVNLASGGSAVLDFEGDGLVGFDLSGLDDGAGSRVVNSGRIEADGGSVLMTARTADALISSVVNNEGIVRAESVSDRNGRIHLEGDGRVGNSGVLNTSGLDGGEGGGSIRMLGDEILIGAGGRVDASGDAGGGRIEIGGSFKGAGPLRNARRTTLEDGSRVSADALKEGDGGTVIIWSDERTRIDGRVSARGGETSGDGGFVETSSARELDFSVPADVGAEMGSGGTWLIDPEDIVIDGGKAASIESALNDGSNVSIATSSEGDGEGNITVASGINKSEGDDAALTLDAHNRIDVDAPIISTSGKLDVNLKAGSKININSEIETNSGSLSATIKKVVGAASGDDDPGDAGSTDTDDASPAVSADGSDPGDGAVETQDATDAAPPVQEPDGSTQPGIADEPDVPELDESTQTVDIEESDVPDLDESTQTADMDEPDVPETNDGESREIADSGGVEDDSGVRTDAEEADVADDDNEESAEDSGIVDVSEVADLSDLGIEVEGAVDSDGGDILIDSRDRATRVAGRLDASSEDGRGGRIQLLGDAVVLEGAELDAGGTEGGGDVLIGTDDPAGPGSRTGSVVVIDAGSRVDADGIGNADGGNVAVWSREFTGHEGSITARGGGTGGDGGFVELSSVNRVNLEGGTFDVTAPSGNAGTVLIDPVTLDVNSDQLTGGANLILQADERLTVAPGVVISTRDLGAGTDHFTDASAGDSGNLTLQSELIEIDSGAALLSFADNSFNSGDILLDASAANNASDVTDSGVAETESGIVVEGALLRGGNVELNASAETNVVYDDATTYTGGGQYTDVSTRLGARLGHGFGTDPVMAGVSVAGATATIEVEDSTIRSDGTVTLNASALADATVNTTDEALSVAYGETAATASVNVSGSSLIDAVGDVQLNSTTTNNTTVATNALSSQVYRPLPTGSNDALVTLAVADTIANSTATLGDGSRIVTTGAADVKAVSNKTVAALSAANAFREGTIGQSTGLSFADVATTARVDGAVSAADLAVTANTTTVATNTGALAGFAGTASSKQLYQDISGQLNAFFVDQTLQHTLGISLSTALPSAGSLFSNAYQNLSPAFQNQFGTSLPSTNTFNQQVVNPVTNQIQNRVYRALVWELPGSSVFSDHVNDTDAIIGATAEVKVDNGVEVHASMLDDGVQNFSHSAVQPHNPTYYSSNPNQQSAITSVAIMATIHDNDADAFIEGGAIIDAGGLIDVLAQTDLPNDGIVWPNTSPINNAANRLSAIDLSLQNLANVGSQLGGIFDDFAQDLRDQGDILAGLVTTSAKARAGTASRRFGGATAIGIAGSANLIKINNNAFAGIGDGAMINQDLAFRGPDQDVNVQAYAALDTVNLSGNIGVIPPPSGTGTGNTGAFLGIDKASRDTNGAGSSLLGLRFNNGAVAEIQNGVLLHAETLTVDADSDISNISASVASGTGERYGIKGSFLGTEILVNAEAKVDDGASVEATGVNATAGSAMPRNLNVAVGEINERSPTGSGTQRRDDRWAAAVVDNDLVRNVDAFIGNRPLETAAAGSLTAGMVTLTAANAGLIEGYSLAIDRTAGPTILGDRPRRQTQYNNRFQFRQGRGTRFGIRASIDVSINNIEDDTSAFINGNALVTTPGDLLITATSNNEIQAFAGAATLLTGSGDQRGIAGAYSENSIGANTAAFIDDATIRDAALLSLNAVTVSTISGIAAGGAFANSTDSIVGSVVNNSIGNAADPFGNPPAVPVYGTVARLEGADINVNGPVTVNASDTSAIDAIAGALAKSNSGGYGGAFSLNAVGNRVDALVDGSSVTATGALGLHAVNDATIESWAGALGLGQQDAFAGALGWNDISNVTRARIVGGKPAGVGVAAGAITVSAVDHSLIDSFVGAFGNSKNRAIGVAVAINEMANETGAGIVNTVVAAPDIDLTAHAGEPGDDNEIDTFAVGLANAGGDGFSVSVAVNKIGNTTRAYLTDNAEIRDTTNTSILDLDLDARSYSLINLLSASITNSTPSGGGGQTTRVNQNPGQHLLPGGSFGLDISADVALNTIVDDTLAYIDGGSVVDITGPVRLFAQSDADIETVTGAVQRSSAAGGPDDLFGVAGVFSMNELGGQTAAWIDNAVVATDAALDLTAVRIGTVEAIAAGWKTGSRAGLAGAVTYNNVYSTTGAYIRNNADITSGSATDLSAFDIVDLFSLSGALMLDANQGGIGAGIAINDLARTNGAFIDNSAVGAAGLDVGAITGGEVNAWAISIERAPAGLSGTLTFNRFNDTTEAAIREGRGTRPMLIDGDVSLQARNTVQAFSLSGAGAISKAGGGIPAAVGVAVGWNEMGAANRTAAYIEHATVATDAAATGQSVSVSAVTNALFESAAVSGALSGQFNIAGSAVINRLAGSTEAFIDDSNVWASQNVLVLADNDLDVNSLAPTLAFSQSQTFGFGGAVTVNLLDTVTRARVFDSNGAAGGLTTVEGLGSGAVPAFVYNGTLDAGIRQLEPLSGVGVVASSNVDVENTSATLSAGGQIALGAAVSVNLVNDTVRATVEPGVSINPVIGSANALQRLHVVAGNHHRISSTDGALAAAQTAAVGAAVDYTRFGKVTEARLIGATSRARNGIAVRARSDETLETVVIGGQLGDGAVGLAGSVSIAVFDNTTDAGIQGGSTETPGGLEVLATDSTATELIAGGFSAGDNTVGVGGSVIYVESSNKTRAWIENDAEVDATGTTRVTAHAVQDINTTAVAGRAGGDLAIAGAASVKYLSSSALAGIRGGAMVNQDPAFSGTARDVLVAARGDVFVNGIATGVQLVGDLGVGAGVDVNLVNDTVLAAVEDETDDTFVEGRDIGVSAESRKDIGGVAIAGSASSRVALSGAVSLTAIASGVNQDMADAIGALAVFGPGAASPLQAPSLPGIASVTVPVNNNFSNTKPVSSVIQTGVTMPLSGTTARIGVNASTAADRDVIVQALLESDTDLVAGDISLSQSGAAIGAGVSFLTMRDSTRADIDSPDGVEAGRHVVVDAGEDAVSNNASILGDNDTSTLAGFSGGFASATLGGGVVYLDKSNNTLATIVDTGSSPVSALGGSIHVLAHSAGLINSTAAGLSAGGNDVSGAVIINNLHNLTEARVVRAMLRADDNLLVFADAANGLELLGGKLSLPSGIEVGGVLTTVISDNETRAYVDDDADVWAGGNGAAVSFDNGRIGNSVHVDLGELDLDKETGTPETEAIKGVGVVATSVNNIDHVSLAGSLGGTIGVAASLAATFVEDTVEAYIGGAGLGGVKVNDPAVGLPAGGERQVRVAAGNHTATNALAGLAEIGGSAGAAGAINLVAFGKETRAFIDNAERVHGEQRIGVEAVSSEQQSSVSVGGQFLSSAGLAGGAGLIVHDNLTEAGIIASTVRTPGDLRVHAQDDSELDLLSGGTSLTAGALGVGVGLNIIELTSQTRAFIDDVDGVNHAVDVGGILEVDADSSNDIFDLAIAGTVAANASVAGGISIKNVQHQTEASLGDSVKVNQDDTLRGPTQDVMIDAYDELIIRGAAGAVALGSPTSSGAIGAGIDIVVVNDRVAAATGVSSAVDAGRDVVLGAQADKSISSLAIGASAGTLAASGAVSSVVLGSSQNPDAAGLVGLLLDEFNNGVDPFLNDYLINPIQQQIGLTSTATVTASRAPDLSGLSRHLRTGAGVPADSATVATIGPESLVDAGRDVGVEALNLTDVRSTAGNGTLTGLGVGIGVSVASGANDVEASLGAGSTITAGRDIKVFSGYGGYTPPLINGRNFSARTYGGTAAALGGQVNLGFVQVDAMLDAFAGSGVILNVGNDLFIQTEYDVDQNAETVAVAVGAYSGALGKATSIAKPQSRARLDPGATVSGAVNATITNLVKGSSIAEPIGAAVGGVEVDKVDAIANGLPIAHAYVAGGASIAATGHVDIGSRGAFETRATAKGGAGSLAVSIATLSATATGGADFQAYVDGTANRTFVSGSSVEIAAGRDASGEGFEVAAEVVPVAVGGLDANGLADANATDSSAFKAGVSGNAEVTAAAGALNILSGIPVTVRSDISGGAGSIGIATTFADARATTNTLFEAYVDGNHATATTVVSGRTVELRAGGDFEVNTDVDLLGVSVGLLEATNNLDLIATDNSVMRAFVRDRATVEGEGDADNAAVTIASGADVAVDAQAEGGAGSLLMSDVMVTIDAIGNTRFESFVSGNTDAVTTVRDADDDSSDILILAGGELDVKSHMLGGTSFSLAGSSNVLDMLSKGNADLDAYVDGNALVESLGSTSTNGRVRIAAGGDLEVQTDLGAGSGSLLLAKTDFTGKAVDNSSFNARIDGAGSGDTQTRVLADDGIGIVAHGGTAPGDDGVTVKAEGIGMSFSGLAADNAIELSAVAKTRMDAGLSGFAFADAGGGALELLAGDTVNVIADLDAGAGAGGVAVDRPDVKATGDVTFTAALDGDNPDHTVEGTGNRVIVGAHGGDGGITVDGLINGGSGGGLVAVGLAKLTAKDLSNLRAFVNDRAEVTAVTGSGAGPLIDGHVDIYAASDLLVSAVINTGSGAGLASVDTSSVKAIAKPEQTAYLLSDEGPLSVTGQTVLVNAGGRLVNDGGTVIETKPRVRTLAELNTGSGAGAVNVGASTVKATDQSRFDAHAAGNVTLTSAGLTRIGALAEAWVSAEYNGGGGAGIVDVGASDIDALGQSVRTAYIDGLDSQVTVDAPSLEVLASAGAFRMNTDDEIVDSGLTVDALVNGGGGGGVVSVGATTLDAKDESELSAYLVDGVVVTDASLSKSIRASGDVYVRAEQNGGGGAGGVSVQTPKTTATARTEMKAWVGGEGDVVTLRGDDLEVIAGGNGNLVTVFGEMNGGSGAGLVGVSDTDVTVKDETTFEAFLDRGSVIDLSTIFGELEIDASSASRVSGVLRGGSGSGVVNVDVPTVNVTGDSTLKAYIDGSAGPVVIDAASVDVEASSLDDGLYVDAILTGGSGTGGVNVGVSVAKATQSSRIDARILGDVDIDTPGVVSVVSSSGDIIAKADLTTGSGAGGVNVETITTEARNDSDFDARIEAAGAASVPEIKASNLFVWAGADAGGGQVTDPNNRDAVFADLDATLGTGSGAGLVSASDPNANAIDTMTVNALAGGRITLSNDLYVLASSNVDLYAKPVGEAVGLLAGAQGAHSKTTRKGETRAELATACFSGAGCGATVVGGDVKLRAGSGGGLVASTSAGAGGFVGVANATATATFDTEIAVLIGSGESVEAGGDVILDARSGEYVGYGGNATLDIDTVNLAADSFASAGGAGVNVTSRAKSDIVLDISATIGSDASINATHVYATADGTSPAANADAQVNFGAAGASVNLLAQSTFDSSVVVAQETGAIVRATDGVTYLAEHQSYALTNAVKGGEAIDGGTAFSLALPHVVTEIDFQTGARIYTYDVDFEANNFGTAIATGNSNSITIDPLLSDYLDTLADVIVNGDIIMLNSLPQHLVIHADGTIETVSGEISAQLVGQDVVVDDLVNNRVGTIRFAALSEIDEEDQEILDTGIACSGGLGTRLCLLEMGYSSVDVSGYDDSALDTLAFSAVKNGRVRGTTGTLQYANAYPYVLIENFSDHDVVVNDIVISTPGTAVPTFTLDSDNTRDPDYQSWFPFRETIPNTGFTYLDPNSTFDLALPSRYYIITDDTASIENVPDDLVLPSALPFTDHLEIVGTDGDSSVRIFNTTDADVLFNGLVDSEGTSGSIGIFNEGGRIALNPGGDGHLQTHDFTAYAYGGAIGGSASSLPVDLVPVGSTQPFLTAFAPGPIYIDTRITDTLGDPITESAATARIGDVISGSNVTLGFLAGGEQVFDIEGDIFGLALVDMFVNDPDSTTLNITGSIESGVEDYHVDVFQPFLLDPPIVEVDLSNVALSAPNPDGTYQVAVDKFTGDLFLFKPLSLETDAPPLGTGRAYNEGDLIGFEWTTSGGRVTFDSDIEHRPGRVEIDGTSPVRITGDGRLSQLDGYSQVFINNVSDHELALANIDVDMPGVPETRRRINFDGILSTESEIEFALALDVEDFGSSEGLINVTTDRPFSLIPAPRDPNTILAGDLLNRSGLVRIVNPDGNITRDGSFEVRANRVWFEGTALNGAPGAVGTPSDPIRTEMMGDLVNLGGPGATVNAFGTGGGVYIRELTGDLELELAETNGGLHDVELTAQRSLVDLNGNDRNILGYNVRLVAETGSIDTDLTANGYVDAEALGGSSGSAGNINIHSIGPIALRNVASRRDTTITASGSITDVAGSMIDVQQHARFDSGSNAIVLGDNPTDVVNFRYLTFNGGMVDITEDSDMAVREHSTADSLKLTADGSIRQPNAGPESLVVENETVLDAATSIFLRHNANDFKGRVDARGTFITLGDANDVLLGDVLAENNLNVRAFDGTITDTGPVVVTEKTTLEATEDIILDAVLNDFMGQVNSDGVNVTLTDRNSILLGTTVARGELSVTALDGTITDNDAARIDGLTMLMATEEIILDTPTNDFRDSVSAVNSTLPHDGSVGFDIVLVDRNTLELDRIIAGRNLRAESAFYISDREGSVIDVPYLAEFTNTEPPTPFGSYGIRLGDNATDTVNFGHYGVDAFGGDQFGLTVNGGPVRIFENSATNFAGFSRVDSLAMSSDGDMTDTGEVEVTGESSLKVTDGNSIYLDTKHSAYFGDVVFDAVSGTGNVDNIRFIDSSDLLLNPVIVTGFLDIAALYELVTSDIGEVRSMGGDISLNGYNELAVGRGGVFGPGKVNLAAADGGFGRRPSQYRESNLFLRGDVVSTGGKISLLAGDNILYDEGIVRTPADASLMASRGTIGRPGAPVQLEVGGIATLFLPSNDANVAGNFEAVTTQLHGSNPPDPGQYFDDVFFRGLPTVPPEPVTTDDCAADPAACVIEYCARQGGEYCDITRIPYCEQNPGRCQDKIPNVCEEEPELCKLIPRTPDCLANPDACFEITVEKCLAEPEQCGFTPCAGPPGTCTPVPWLETIIKRPYEPVKGNAISRIDTTPYELTICNGVNLFGENEECNPVNEEVEIFEIDEPLYRSN